MRSLPVLAAAVALGSVGLSAQAGDADAWRPGAPSSRLDAPLSGPSGELLEAGTQLGGAWTQLAGRPVMALDLAADEPVWLPAVGMYSSAGIYGGWRPASWAAPYDLGGRLRARVAALDPADTLGLPGPSPVLDDAALWLRRELSAEAGLQRALSFEARVDFDGLGAPADELRQLSGAGTGVELGWAERRETSVPGLSQHLALTAAADLRPAGLAPRQAVEGRLGWGWAPGRLAGLGELHGRVARHAPEGVESWLAASVEPRLGLRGQAGDHLQWTGVVGSGLPFRDPVTDSWVQPTGAPRWRVGLDLRWVPERSPDEADAARAPGPGQLVVAPRSPSGRRLVALVDGQTALPRPDGSVVMPYTAGEPVTVTAKGHASVTLSPRVVGDGPWTWAPTLPVRSGEAELRLRVADEQERAVDLDSLKVADVELGGISGSTGVTVSGLAGGSITVSGEGPLLLLAEAKLEAAVEASEQSFYLARPVGATRVVVQADGQPVPGARVQLLSAAGVSELETDAQGVVQTRLTAGQWRIRVDAEGLASQEQSVEIGAGQGRLHEVPFALRPPASEQERALELTVIDPSGQPIEGAAIRLGDQELGTTASGGRLRLEGLKEGAGRLQVIAERFRSYEARVVKVEEPEQRLVVPLRWQSGQVEIRAMAIDGTPLATAVARVRSEADALDEARPLGPDGLLAFELPSGEHEVVVTAPGYTSVVVPVRVYEDRDSLHVAHVVLRPASLAPASLSVRVSSPMEVYVEDARILVDGVEVARTSSGSAVLLEGLAAGPRQISIEGELYEPWTKTVDLEEGGSHSLAGDLKPRSGLLEATAAFEGEPISALVRLVGVRGTRPILLGADGRHLFRVPAGSWEVVYSAEAYGIGLLKTQVHPERDVTAAWHPTRRRAPTAMAAPAPRAVEVVVKIRATGQPVSALVRAIGPEVIRPTPSGIDGRLQLSLTPGRWDVVVSNPALGVGGAQVEVSTSGELEDVEVLLGPAKVELGEDEVRLDGRVLFEVGSARIERSSLPLLQELGRTLVLAPELRRVRVEGHTDATGEAEANLRLSEARAQAVMDWLIAAGVSPDRLDAQGFGEQEPVASNDDEAGRLQNRRVVLRILEREAVGADEAQ